MLWGLWNFGALETWKVTARGYFDVKIRLRTRSQYTIEGVLLEEKETMRVVEEVRWEF